MPSEVIVASWEDVRRYYEAHHACPARVNPRDANGLLEVFSEYQFLHGLAHSERVNEDWSNWLRSHPLVVPPREYFRAAFRSLVRGCGLLWVDLATLERWLRKLGFVRYGLPITIDTEERSSEEVYGLVMDALQLRLSQLHDRYNQPN